MCAACLWHVSRSPNYCLYASPPSFVRGTHHACSKMPEKDAEYLTPATRLLEKKREMAEVEEALSTTKEVSGRCTDRALHTRTHTVSHCNYSECCVAAVAYVCILIRTL